MVKDPNSNRVNDLLIHNTIPVTLYNNFLMLRDTERKFVLQDLLKMITNRTYVDHATLSDKNITFELAKEMNFDVKAPGNKTPRDRSLIKLIKSPFIMASGISTIF